MINDHQRARLGVDGNCGFALLGANIQEGEAEFVEIIDTGDSDLDKMVACKKALLKLRERLNKPTLNYFFGAGHPYGEVA